MNSIDRTNNTTAHPLVTALRRRARHLKYIAAIYLVFILLALGGGGYLFYWLPQVLVGQEQKMSQLQNLSIKKGVLEASKEFAALRWKIQRDDALADVVRKGFSIAQTPFPHILSVHFTTTQTGWAVGEEGTILSTIDGGKSWQQQSSGTQYDLVSVHFITAQTGWTVGESGGIFYITVLDDTGIRAAETLDKFAQALDTLAVAHKIDLTVFQNLIKADQQEISRLDEKLTEIDHKIGRLKNQVNETADQKDVNQGSTGFVDPLNQLSTNASMTLNFTRIGVIGFVIYFISILFNLYRYSMRLAAFYDSRADVLELKQPADTEFTALIDNFSPDHLNFGKQTQNPASQAIELAKEVTQGAKIKVCDCASYGYSAGMP